MLWLFRVKIKDLVLMLVIESSCIFLLNLIGWEVRGNLEIGDYHWQLWSCICSNGQVCEFVGCLFHPVRELLNSNMFGQRGCRSFCYCTMSKIAREGGRLKDDQDLCAVCRV